MLAIKIRDFDPRPRCEGQARTLCRHLKGWTPDHLDTVGWPRQKSPCTHSNILRDKIRKPWSIIPNESIPLKGHDWSQATIQILINKNSRLHGWDKIPTIGRRVSSLTFCSTFWQGFDSWSDSTNPSRILISLKYPHNLAYKRELLENSQDMFSCDIPSPALFLLCCCLVLTWASECPRQNHLR